MKTFKWRQLSFIGTVGILDGDTNSRDCRRGCREQCSERAGSARNLADQLWTQRAGLTRVVDGRPGLLRPWRLPTQNADGRLGVRYALYSVAFKLERANLVAGRRYHERVDGRDWRA